MNKYESSALNKHGSLKGWEMIGPKGKPRKIWSPDSQVETTRLNAA